jgi:RHS repeat-associated protein
VNGSAYAFDSEGTKRFEQKLVDGVGSDARSEAYAYDATYRLVDYRVGTLSGNTVPAPLTQTQYTLDAVGNWTQKVKDGVPQNRTHDATNALTQIGAVPIFSDDDGNTRQDGVFRYAYDEENRLVAVTRIADARVVGRYEYDALGRRVKKIADPGPISSPAETRYFYDSQNLVEEQSDTGITLGTWVYGDALDDVLAMTRGPQAYFFHENSLGSIEAVTDAAGTPVERYAYDAYGAPAVSDGAGIPLAPNAWGTARSAIGNPWIFTARQLDEETGLVFYRARHYDTDKGRFLQRDPVDYVDGMNLYEYVGSHPTMARDALGRELRVGGKALNNGSEFYKKMAQNDFYKQVLDKMIASKETFRRTSENELELELKMRDAFIKCMEKHRAQGAGCQYGPKYPWTPSKMWEGNAYKGKSASAALDAFQNGVPDKATGLIESSELDCYSMGHLCLWIALRDALGAEKFDARFKDKRIVITQSERVYVMALRRNVFATPYLRDSTEMLPGDFVQFHNHPDYYSTRRANAGRSYSSENAVYVGVRDGKDKFCGFGIEDIVTREEMMQELLDDYNKGAVPGTPKRTLDNTKINIGNLRRPNPAFTLP